MLLVFIFLFIFTVYLVFFEPLLKIQKIEINGIFENKQYVRTLNGLVKDKEDDFYLNILILDKEIRIKTKEQIYFIVEKGDNVRIRMYYILDGNKKIKKIEYELIN